MNAPTDRKPRTVFFLSDQTGITAETLGRSLLTQFDDTEFRPITVPFIDTIDKAREVAERINETARKEGRRALVFSTLVADEIRGLIEEADCTHMDFFDTFIGPLERELKTRSSHAAGRAHGMHNPDNYSRRIDAMNFALANDDGVTSRNYGQSEVILVGVSRSGKTPTCLYLALHYGIYAANCPLTEDDLEDGKLPPALEEHKHKIFGLTIDPARLQGIRNERRPNSRYSSTRQVLYEVKETEALFRRYGIPFVNTTQTSVEEIAATVLHGTGLERHIR